MKYITIDKIRYYVMLRDKSWDFKCHECQRRNLKFASLSLKPNDEGCMDSLICAKCGHDSVGDLDFLKYLKRQKISLKSFFSKIELELIHPNREIVKIKRSE